jgi:hypothetical protein
MSEFVTLPNGKNFIGRILATTVPFWDRDDLRIISWDHGIGTDVQHQAFYGNVREATKVFDDYDRLLTLLVVARQQNERQPNEVGFEMDTSEIVTDEMLNRLIWRLMKPAPGIPVA